MRRDREIRFRDRDRIVTLWVEKEIDEYTLGWCPELGNNIAVHADNIVHEEPRAITSDDDTAGTPGHNMKEAHDG